MTSSIEKFASFLHLFLCKQPHGSEAPDEKLDPSKCHWYTEEQMENHWQSSEHQKWLKKAIVIQGMADIDDARLDVLSERLTSVISQTNFLVSQFPALQEVVLEIINSTFNRSESS